MTGVRFAAKFDGKQYPQIGRFAPTVDADHLRARGQADAQVRQRDSGGKDRFAPTRAIVSADGKTMTIEQKTTDAKGPAGR